MIVAHGNQIAMEPTLEQSLARIFGGRLAPTPAAAATTPAGTAPTPLPADRAVAQRALEIYQRSQDALRRGDWATYGTEQKRLEETLRELTTGRR